MTDTFEIQYKLTAKDQASATFKKLQSELTGTRQQLQNTQQATQGNTSAIGGLTTAVQGLVLGYIGTKGINMVSEMYQQGEAARRVDTAFSALSAQVGGYKKTLDSLITATGQVVDNTTLQASANLMLGTHVARTREELASFTEMAVKLGSVFAPGASASENLNNFTLMMSNQSVRRLDTFGISAAEVTKRMNELKQAGMDTEDAFRMATMEQGTQALKNLGDSANVGQTAIARLETSWSNFISTVEESVATTLNQALDSLSQIWYIATHFQAGGPTSRPNVIAQEVGPQWQAWMMSQGQSGVGPGTGYLIPGHAGAGTVSVNFAEAAAAAQAAQFQQQLQAAQVSGPGMQFAAMQNLYTYGGYTSEYGNVRGMTRQPWTGQAILDPATAEMLGGMAQQIAQSALDAKEAYGDLITEDQQNAMDQAVKNAQKLADDANRAADNFERMSLATQMGQTGGGRLGEIAALVGNLLPENLQGQYNRQAGMMTGQQTTMSQLMNNKIAPYLAQMYQVNPQAALAAMQNLQTYMNNASLAGWSPQQMAQYAMPSMGYQMTGGTQQFQITPGMTAQQAMQAGGFTSYEQLYAATGATSTRNIPIGTFGGAGGQEVIPTELPQQVQDLLQNFRDISDNTDQTATHMDNINTAMEGPVAKANEFRDRLKEVTNKSWETKFKFNVTPMINGNPATVAWFTMMMADAVKANGGKVPGLSERSG